ncbi:single-stranded DNA-binding protein [Latilactobacillus fragifolii]|uniref:single-stranded DNA-binding protein n=1 Tax=Latilactobacillus fragifolii TaxID=2814244 RepID=UPI001ABB10F6|nr:single-stranded DNA-binding protein [Latilactobacillus fragifolii]
MVNEFYVSGQIVHRGPLEQKKSGQSIAKVIITNEVNIQQSFEDNFLTIIFWGEMAKKLVNETEKGMTILVDGQLINTKKDLEKSQNCLLIGQSYTIKTSQVEQPRSANTIEASLSDPAIKFEQK